MANDQQQATGKTNKMLFRLAAGTVIGGMTFFGYSAVTAEYNRTMEAEYTGVCTLRQDWAGGMFMPATFETELNSIQVYDPVERDWLELGVRTTFAPRNEDGSAKCAQAFNKGEMLKLAYTTNFWREHILGEKPQSARIISPEPWKTQP